MTQPAQNAQPIREEERVLGITYERALAMMPKLLESVTGAAPQALGDGYLVVPIRDGSQRRELTVRLGRQGADTRFSVRAESFNITWMITLIIAVAIFTAGLGIIPLIPWMQRTMRQQARERDLLIHRTFRAIEDAVAEQGSSMSYRIAPGADANVRVEEAEPLSEPSGDEAKTLAK